MIRDTKVSLIVAMDQKRGIGKNNDLLFKIPEDAKRMRDLTTGHPLIMGRKTFESLGRLLPNRTHIVVTRNPSSLQNLSYQPHAIVSSIKEGIEIAKNYPGNDEVFIFGGGQIYAESLKENLVDKLYLTIVEARLDSPPESPARRGDFDADTFFPDYSEFKKVVFEQNGESGGYKYKFLELEK